MAELESEIARLQAEIDQRRMQTEALRSYQPQSASNHQQQVEQEYYDEVEEVSEYSEYEEEEIIEEYDSEEWEEEIIEEEIVEEDDEILEEEVEEIVVIEDDDDEPSTTQYHTQIMPQSNISALYTVSTPPTPTEPIASPPQQAVGNPAACQLPLTTKRTWTPSYLRKQEEQKAPTTVDAAPVSPRWKRPTPPAAALPAQPTASTAPSWATKQLSKTKTTTPVPTITSAQSVTSFDTAPPPTQTMPAPTPSSNRPAVRNKPRVRSPPDANGNVTLNDPPPGLDIDGKPKGPRIKIINWGANRRSNTAIQTETRPNFKPSLPGGSTTDTEKVKRNYVIPKGIKSPLGTPDEKTASATATKAGGGGHRRRTIPDIPASVPGEETLWEKLLGSKLIANSKLHKKNTIGCMKDIELVGLYFGCKMKPECKFFHPRLQDFYFSGHAQQQNMEIIYVSSDRTLNDFKELFARMPYLAIPGGGTASIKNNLSNMLKIIEQPTLVILDDEGMVITVDAVQQIQSLERGNIEQANELISRWKRTRPVSMEQVQRDFALQYGKLQRGILYWQE
jgi:Thioredoxin-like